MSKTRNPQHQEPIVTIYHIGPNEIFGMNDVREDDLLSLAKPNDFWCSCICYTNLDELSIYLLKWVDHIVVLQYNIPDHQQQKILDAYNKEQICRDCPCMFSESQEVGRKELLDYDNYVGYWICRKDKKNNVIHKQFVERSLCQHIENHYIENNGDSESNIGLFIGLMTTALSIKYPKNITACLLLGGFLYLAHHISHSENSGKSSKLNSMLSFFAKRPSAEASSCCHDLDPKRQVLS